MRGKLVPREYLNAPIRITPAHAGKTFNAHVKAVVTADHPRACGENYFFPACLAVQPGSPPRMRGKHIINIIIACFLRITPAHAGKTTRIRQNIFASKDHPRACGENFLTAPMIALYAGSPPRMRGKLFQFVPVLNTYPDHPRACGENYKISSNTN